MMFELIKEVYYVSWADIRFMRHNLLNVLIMSLMSPFLYLLAFGYGLGNNVVTNGVPYIAFIIPGIVALSSLSSSFSSTSTRLNIQRLYYKSFDEMMMCPLRCSAIVIGKATLGVIRGMLSCSIIFVAGLFLAPELVLAPIFVICLILSCYTFSFLGEAAALLAKSHQSMATFNSLVITPMIFLCGTFFSVATLPAVIQAVLYAFPLTHSSTCIRAAALGWEFPWISLLAMVMFCVAFFVIDLHLLRTRKT